jgi:hypothetical protein
LERISTGITLPEKEIVIRINFVLFSVRRKIFVDLCKRWCEVKEDKGVFLKRQKRRTSQV